MKEIKKRSYDSDIYINFDTTNLVNMDFHFHDSYEIYHSISGGQNFIINDCIYTIKPKDLFIINTNEIHKTSSQKNEIYHRYIITFYPQLILPYCTEKTNLLDCFLLNNNDSPRHKINLTDSEHKTLVNMYDKFIALPDAYGSDILQKNYLTEILININSYFKQRNKSKLNNDNVDRNINTDYEIIIKPLIDYINNNYTHTLTLEKLSNHMNISKYHLCKLFKKHTGTTINRYIIARRISEAKNLLNRGLTVSEVCPKVGFGDYSHFIRTFTTLVGTSPLRYAKKKTTP